jgi:hypothetical protein
MIGTGTGISNGRSRAAVYKLTENPRHSRAGKFAFRLGNADVQVNFARERTIDLNFAPKQLLVGLFTVLGTEPERQRTPTDHRLADAGIGRTVKPLFIIPPERVTLRGMALSACQ